MFACGIAGPVSLRRVCLCRGSPSFDEGGLRQISSVLLFALMLTATSMASFGQAAAPAKYPRVVTELHLISGRKPKHALVFAEQLIPRPTIEDYEFGNAGHKVECKGESQPDFACALVFNFDPPVPDGIASVSGSEYDLIRGIMLRLDGTLYTTVFDCVRSATKEREWIFRPGEGHRHSRKS